MPKLIISPSKLLSDSYVLWPCVHLACAARWLPPPAPLHVGSPPLCSTSCCLFIALPLIVPTSCFFGFHSSSVLALPPASLCPRHRKKLLSEPSSKPKKKLKKSGVHIDDHSCFHFPEKGLGSIWMIIVAFTIVGLCGYTVATCQFLGIALLF